MEQNQFTATGGCQTASMIEDRHDIRTSDGTMPTFIVRPTHGGPHPVVLYLMDAPGIRPALMDMASRLASAGYYVMVPYLYCRGAPFQRCDLDVSGIPGRSHIVASI